MKEIRESDLDEAVAVLRSSPRSELAERAWETIYGALWPYAFAVAYRTLRGHPDAAKDATQDAFLRLLRSVAVTQLRDSRELRTYLGRMAYHSAIDHHRRETRKSRSSHPEPLAAAEGLPDTAPTADDLIQRDEVLAAISRGLSAPDLRLLSLVVDGYSPETMADEFDVDRATLRVRLHRLRERIRTRLGDLYRDKPPQDGRGAS